MKMPQGVVEMVQAKKTSQDVQEGESACFPKIMVREITLKRAGLGNTLGTVASIMACAGISLFCSVPLSVFIVSSTSLVGSGAVGRPVALVLLVERRGGPTFDIGLAV